MFIESLIITIIIDELKNGIDKLRSNHPIKRTISQISKKFKNIENLPKTLEKWLENKEVQNKIKEFVEGNREINSKELAKTLVKDCGFYFGEASEAKSVEIIQDFFSILNEEYLESKEKHIYTAQRKEVLTKIILDEGKTTQKTIKESQLAIERAITGLSSQFAQADHYKDKFQSQYTRRIDEAREILKAGKVETAKKLYENLLSDLSKEKDVSKELYFRIWTNLGCCELELGQCEEAASYLERAHNILPENDKGIANMVTAMQLRDNYPAGLEYANKLLEKNPQYHHGICVKAGLLAEIGSFDDAISLFKDDDGSFNNIILNDAQCCYTLGFVFYEKKDYENSQEFLKKAIKFDSSNPDFFSLLGLSICFPLLQKKTFPWLISKQVMTQLKNAEQYLSHAYEILQEQENYKKLENVLINRSSVRIALNKIDDAINDCKEILKKDPDNLQSLKNKGIAEIRRGQFDLAIIDWTKAFKKHKDIDELVSLIATAYLSKDIPESEKAIQIIEKYLSEHEDKKDNLSLLFDLTECYLSKEDRQQTEKFLAEIKKMSPDNPRLFHLYSKLYVQIGDMKKAENYILEALDKSKGVESQIFSLDLANLYFNQKSYDKAISYYQDIVNPSVNNKVLRDYLICLYYSSNKVANYPKCLKICEKIRNKFGTTKLITEIEAVIQESLNNLEEASSLYLALSNIEPEKYEHRLRYGFVEFRRGNHKLAVKKLEEIKDTVANDPQALMTISEIFDYVGKKVDAIMLGFNALKLASNDPKINMAYIHLFLSKDIDGKNKLFSPKKIEKDTHVKLKINGEEKIIILVDTKKSDLIMGELSINSDFGSKLVGLKVGDKVELKVSDSLSQIINILEVKSKYVKAFQDCIQSFNLQFPKDKGFKLIKVGKDLKNLFNILDETADRASKFTDLYKQRKLTIGALSNLLGIDLFDAWVVLTNSPELNLRCSIGSVKERQYELNIAEKSSRIIIDLIGLFTLAYLDCYDFLTRLFSEIYISQSSLDEITLAIGLESSLKRKGYETIGKHKDRYIRRKIEPKDVREKIRLLKKIHRFIINKTKVIGFKKPISFFEQRLVDVLGKPSFDTIRIAKENNLTLYSDDLFLRELAFNEYSINNFEIQTLLRKALQHNIIQEDYYYERIIKLVLSRYSFVSINGKILFYSFETSGTALASQEFKILLEFIESLTTTTISAINVLSDFLKLLWIEPIPANIKKEYLYLALEALTKKRGTRNIMKPFKNAVKRNFYYIPLHSTEVLKHIMLWERHQFII